MIPQEQVIFFPSRAFAQALSPPGSARLALLTLATQRPLLALGEDQELPQLLAPSLPRRLCLVSCPHGSADAESACSAGDLR